MAAGPSTKPCQWHLSRLLSSAQSVHQYRRHSTLSTSSPSTGVQQVNGGSQNQNGASSDSGPDFGSVAPYALLILNQPLNTAALNTLVDSATYIICADGGANKYLEYYQQAQYSQTHRRQSPSSASEFEAQAGQLNAHDVREPRLPSAIIGDLDSLDRSTREFFAARGVPIIQDGDQYCTDYAKALKLICAWARGLEYVSAAADEQTSTLYVNRRKDQNQSWHRNGAGNGSRGQSESHRDGDGDNNGGSLADGMDVIVLGSLGGRVDQGISQIHHLYLASNYAESVSTPTHTSSSSEPAQSQQTQPQNQSESECKNPYLAQPHNKIYLLSESSLSFVLNLGKNEIHISRQDVEPASSSSPQSPAPYAQKQEKEQQQKEEQEREKKEVVVPTFTENVGVLPIAGPAVITLSGFEWDVEHWQTQLGGLMSTSNHVRGEVLVVDVEGGNKCLFTIELASRLKVDS